MTQEKDISATLALIIVSTAQHTFLFYTRLKSYFFGCTPLCQMLKVEIASLGMRSYPLPA